MHAPRQLTSRRFQVWQEWLLGHQVSSCLCMCQQPSIKARGMCDCTKWSFSPQSQDKELGQNSALFLCRTAFFLHSSESYLQTLVILKLMNKRVTLLLYRLELQMSSASVGLWGEIAFFRGGLELNESTERWRLLGTQWACSVTSHSLLLHSWVAVVLKCFRFVIIPLSLWNFFPLGFLTCHNGGTQWAL